MCDTNILSLFLQLDSFVPFAANTRPEIVARREELGLPVLAA